MPMIPTPGHGSFPSAHATEAYAVLTVLEALVKKWGSLADDDSRLKVMRGLAERIAVNRTVAGVHFPVDSWAGAALGTAVGRAVLGRCGQTLDMPSFVYKADEASDFFDHDFQNDPAGHGLTHGSTPYTSGAKPAYSWLWEQAAKENQGA
jgi:hypothetical protein